jgi:hypothetical protein
MNLPLLPPRWPNGPHICGEVNMLAHKTEADLKAFLASICMGDLLWKHWRCEACKHWHHICKPKEASAASSGGHTRANDFLHRRHAD